jgi:hypothetical protein
MTNRSIRAVWNLNGHEDRRPVLRWVAVDGGEATPSRRILANPVPHRPAAGRPRAAGTRGLRNHRARRQV